MLKNYSLQEYRYKDNIIITRVVLNGYKKKFQLWLRDYYYYYYYVYKHFKYL